MRLALAEVRSRPRKVLENIRALEGVLGRVPEADLVAFPELYLTGYSIGESVHPLSLREQGPELSMLSDVVSSSGKWVVLGAPLANPARMGETLNAAIAIGPTRQVHVVGKRYLPTFGPFEEGLQFTPGTDRSVIVTPAGKIGLEICYEAFFPEVSTKLSREGADLIVVISASPVTSRILFERLLPARAIENATPVAYVNRFGVEDSLIFAGGSSLFDPRGEKVEPQVIDLKEEGKILSFDVSMDDYARMRPARPVLRDAGILS